MKLDSLVTVLLIATALVFATPYVANRLSINALIYVEITLALAVLALLLPTDVNRNKNKEVPTFRIPFSLWLLPIAVFTVSEVEILLLGQTGLGNVVALAAALTVTAFAREKPMKKVMVATAIVGSSLIQLYTLYAPPSVSTHGGTSYGPLRRYRRGTLRRPLLGTRPTPSRWFRWSMPWCR